MSIALDGIKILDLSTQLPGPYSSMLLADLGAEVIKIEQSTGGDFSRMLAPFFQKTNRNKKSLTLNLKSQEGKEIFYKLAKTADVILEGFRPGVTQNLNIDYNRIKEINPQIIYCSLTGYGQNGPYKLRPGHDINYLGVTGAYDPEDNLEEESVVTSIQIADICGSMFSIVGILSSILMREKTGKGQFVDVSMTDGISSWMSTSVLSYISKLGFKIQKGEGPMLPHYGFFKTKDEKYLTLAIIHEDHFWKNFCKALELDDMVRYDLMKRVTKREKIHTTLKSIFLTKNRDEWIDILDAHDIPFGPVISSEEVLNNPHFLERNLISEIDDPIDGKIKHINFPVKFSEMPVEIKTPAPKLGQHTEEILYDIGYSEEEIVALKEAKII